MVGTRMVVLVGRGEDRERALEREEEGSAEGRFPSLLRTRLMLSGKSKLVFGLFRDMLTSSPLSHRVGNVPSDATHPELWRFFSSRPVPAASHKYANMHPADIPPGVDLNSTGIESIHLISRSNCEFRLGNAPRAAPRPVKLTYRYKTGAFVNYASDIHLQHSIAVSNGLPLRPHDPRCKDLVCRVRKRDEDAKSGVGAQRIGGMHKDFVREKERERREGGAEGEQSEGREGAPQRYSTGSTSHSISTTSTTSSFLAKHFERRFFVLKVSFPEPSLTDFPS